MSSLTSSSATAARMPASGAGRRARPRGVRGDGVPPCAGGSGGVVPPGQYRSNRSTITAVSTGTNATSWKSKMTASMTGSDKA